MSGQWCILFIGSFLLDKVLCRWPILAVHPCKQGQGMSRINAPLPQPLFATGEGMGLVTTQITGEVACRDGQLSHSLDCSRHIGGLQRGGGGAVRGGNLNNWGRARAPVAIVNFTLFMREILVESSTNSEIFTGIWREIHSCNWCARNPNH